MISYQTWDSASGTPSERFHDAILATIAATGAARICDIGAGANPLLGLDLARGAGIRDYVLLDISATELEKAPAGYEKVVGDITEGPIADLGAFDLIVSHTVAEHVRSAADFHRSVHAMLAPGGRAMHFFPTFYEPVFVLNRFLPERLGEAILSRVQPGREKEGEHGKFPALYRWCRGPSRQQLRRLRDCGFEVEEYVGIFGHGYFDSLQPLDRVERWIAEALLRRPVPHLTSYAWAQLRRPA